jgi:hypothetical protein
VALHPGCHMFEKFITAEIIEFYVPRTFRREPTFVAASQRGRIIPFRAVQRGEGLKTRLEESCTRLVSGAVKIAISHHAPASHL